MMKKADLIAWLGSMIMRLWLRTVRFELIDRAGVLRVPPERPLLWTFWHNRLFVMAYMYQRFFPGRLGSALASASRDGEIISAVMSRFGIRAVRGSSSRGGGRALVEMKRAIEAGSIMAITPDGPRGPRYHINPGVIKLAQITGGWVMPIHVVYSRFWQLGSWDGFMIPKPFSRARWIYGEPFYVAPDEPLEAAQRRLTDEINRLQADAERAVRA
ncbi:MAG: lysophospholipid acyltransferase family protein [Verrucomicrobiota bacterium]